MSTIETVSLTCPNCGNASNAIARDLTFAYEFTCRFCGSTSVVTIRQQLQRVDHDRPCLKCGVVNRPGAVRCQECDSSLVRTCIDPDCGKLYYAGFTVCDHCGFPQDVDPHTPLGAEIKARLALRDLASPDPTQRRTASRRLVRLGRKAAFAVPFLPAVLKADPLAVAPVIAAIGDAAAPCVPGLIQQITYMDIDLNVHQAVCKALASIGPKAQPALPALIRVIRESAHTDNHYQMSVVGLAVTAVQQILRNDDHETRQDLIAALVEVLQHSPYDRELHDAALALGQLGDLTPQAEQHLLTLALERPGVRWTAYEVLRASGLAQKRQIALLCDVIEQGGSDLQQACDALVAMGSAAAAAVPLLVQILDGWRAANPARLAAQRALMQIGPAAVKPLIGILADGSMRDPKLALDVLVAVGYPAVDDLTALLKNADPDLQVRLCAALGDIGGKAADALPTLKRLTSLFSGIPGPVKDAARAAITRIEAGI